MYNKPPPPPPPVGTVQWATRIAGTGSDEGNGISVDGSGNSYVTGLYNSTLTIYNADTSTFGTLSNSGSSDGYIVKYNTSGTAQWATRIAGTGIDRAVAISVDSAGNSHVTGNYNSNPLTIYNADGSTFGTLANSGNLRFYIVKYNTSGTAQWAASFNGGGGNGISVDVSGNSYVAGNFSSNPLTIYNADTSTFGTLTNSGQLDAFIVKYNTSGTAQWATRIAGTSNDYAYTISVDGSGNPYVTGDFASNPITIYNADGSTFGTLTNSGVTDTYIVKYNTSGTAQWAARIGGIGNDSGVSAVNSAGNCYVAGNFTSNPLTIYNADTSTFGTLVNSGTEDVYIVKYNTSGTAQWATRIAGTGGEYGNGISVDSAGNCYATGSFFSNPLTIYNADGSTFGTLTNSGSNDLYMVKYNTSGTAQWATRAAGTSGDRGNATSSDGSGNSYVAGNFASNPVTIYNADGSTFGTLANSGSNDAFIVKYA